MVDYNSKIESQNSEVDANNIPFATNGIDCPAYYADIIRGTTVVGETTKINLVEHRVNAQTNEVVARHVVQIIVPTSQLRKWGSYFNKLSDDIGLPNDEP